MVPKHKYATFAALPALIGIGLCTTTVADDCIKAKEVYRQGVSIINYKERHAAFEKAVKLCPSFAEARVNLADAYEKLAILSRHDVAKFNRFLDSAVAEYQKALTYRKDLFAAYLGLGETLRVIGLYSKAEKAYQNALKLKPNHPAAMAGLNKIKTINNIEQVGLQKSEQILEHCRVSSHDAGFGSLMGFKNETVVRDRLRFSNILFNEWSSKVDRPEAVRQLNEIGKALTSRELKDAAFFIEGHTDNRGGRERNDRLSLARAKAIKTYLSRHYDILPSRIKTFGFGLTRPRVPNTTPQNRLSNRRVEILLIREHPTK